MGDKAKILPARSARGRRMAQLMELEDENDREFWEQDVWADDEEPEEVFELPEDAPPAEFDDSEDSDIDAPESEEDEEAAAKMAEASVNQGKGRRKGKGKAKVVSTAATTAERVTALRARVAQRKTAAVERSQRGGDGTEGEGSRGRRGRASSSRVGTKRPRSEEDEGDDDDDDGAGIGKSGSKGSMRSERRDAKRRASNRSSTAAWSKASAAAVAADAAKEPELKPAVTRRRLTQAELLETARITEAINAESLAYLLSEEASAAAVRKLRATGGKSKGPIIRYVSSAESGSALVFPGLDALPSGYQPKSAPTPPAPMVCAITGKPAKYRDPVTGAAYSSVEAFRQLRARAAANPGAFPVTYDPTGELPPIPAAGSGVTYDIHASPAPTPPSPPQVSPTPSTSAKPVIREPPAPPMIDVAAVYTEAADLEEPAKSLPTSSKSKGRSTRRRGRKEKGGIKVSAPMVSAPLMTSAPESQELVEAQAAVVEMKSAEGAGIQEMMELEEGHKKQQELLAHQKLTRRIKKHRDMMTRMQELTQSSKAAAATGSQKPRRRSRLEKPSDAAGETAPAPAPDLAAVPVEPQPVPVKAQPPPPLKMPTPHHQQQPQQLQQQQQQQQQPMMMMMMPAQYPLTPGGFIPAGPMPQMMVAPPPSMVFDPRMAAPGGWMAAPHMQQSPQQQHHQQMMHHQQHLLPSSNIPSGPSTPGSTVGAQGWKTPTQYSHAPQQPPQQPPPQ